MRILFMGTPDFALVSLKGLVEAGRRPVAVVTQPDKPRGRGYTLMPPPVKVYALEQDLPVYQPTTLRGEEFAALLAEMEAMQTLEAKIYKAIDSMEAVFQHNLSDISTWIPHEYQLNQTYGADKAAFSPYLTALREELKKDTLEKIENA